MALAAGEAKQAEQRHAHFEEAQDQPSASEHENGSMGQALAPAIIEELCRAGHIKWDDMSEEQRIALQLAMVGIVADALDKNAPPAQSSEPATASSSDTAEPQTRSRAISLHEPQQVGVRHSVGQAFDGALQAGVVVTSALLTSWVVTALSNANVGSLTLAVLVNLTCYFTGEATARYYIQSRDFTLEVLQWTARTKLEILGIEASVGIWPSCRNLYFNVWSYDFLDYDMDGYIIMFLLRNRYSRTEQDMERAQEFIRTSFRTMALEAHPDRGGSHDRFVELTEAKDWLLNVLAEAARDIPEPDTPEPHGTGDHESQSPWRNCSYFKC